MLIIINIISGVEGKLTVRVGIYAITKLIVLLFSQRNESLKETRQRLTYQDLSFLDKYGQK